MKLTKKQLMSMCESKGIDFSSKMKKAELMALIKEFNETPTPVVEEEKRELTEEEQEDEAFLEKCEMVWDDNLEDKITFVKSRIVHSKTLKDRKMYFRQYQKYQHQLIKQSDLF